MEVLDLTFCKTTQGGKYHLGRVDLNSIADEQVRRFVETLVRTKQIVFDWGMDVFWVHPTPFAINYETGAIRRTDTNAEIGNDGWIPCDPLDLHSALSSVFEGEWGPSSVDSILSMECSGVRVDLCGTKTYGPEDPKGFMESLRRELVSQQG